MELELITKILILITCILNGLMIVLAIIWIWELLDEDVLGKLFITNSLLVMVFIILTGTSIHVYKNKYSDLYDDFYNYKNSFYEEKELK